MLKWFSKLLNRSDIESWGRALLLFLALNRTVGQLILGSKRGGYLLQTLAAGLLILTTVEWNNRSALRKTMTVSFLPLLVAAVSGLLTIRRFGIEASAVAGSYLAVIAFFFLLISVSTLFSPRAGIKTALPSTVLVIGLIIFVAALFQQFFLPFLLPHIFPQLSEADWNRLIVGVDPYISPIGPTIIRPSSLTGSYLHYPLVMPLLAVFLLRPPRRRWHLLVASVFLVSPVLALSRSGTLLSGMFLGLLLLRHAASVLRKRGSSPSPEPAAHPRSANKRRIILLAVLTVLCLIAILSLVRPFRLFLALSMKRLLDFGDPSNLGRFRAWSLAWEAIKRHSLLFGGITGTLSNIPANILGQNPLQDRLGIGVPESSFLGLAASFGLPTAILVYAVGLWGGLRLFRKGDPLTASALIAALLQSLFYQSYEVFPFMFCLSLLLLTRQESSPSVPKNPPPAVEGTHTAPTDRSAHTPPSVHPQGGNP